MADPREPVTYTPAVTAAGATIALYLLSKIGELVVILLMWGAYTALHVVTAWAGVSLLELVREAACRAQEWTQRAALKQKAGSTLVVLKRRNVR